MLVSSLFVLTRAHTHLYLTGQMECCSASMLPFLLHSDLAVFREPRAMPEAATLWPEAFTRSQPEAKPRSTLQRAFFSIAGLTRASVAFFSRPLSRLLFVFRVSAMR